jgi:CRP-like cAMP-binding protein
LVTKAFSRFLPVWSRRELVVGAGAYVGEIALLTASDRTATITATSDLHFYGMTP